MLDYDFENENLAIPDTRWIARSQHWKSLKNPRFQRQDNTERLLYGKEWDKDVMNEYDALISRNDE